MTRGSLKKTGDGKKKLFIHCNPFSNLLSIFVIINAGNSLFDKEDIIGHFLFSHKKMILWHSPFFPCSKKNTIAFW